jgi:hypothetical protein
LSRNAEAVEKCPRAGGSGAKPKRRDDPPSARLRRDKWVERNGNAKRGWRIEDREWRGGVRDARYERRLE